MGCGKSVKYYEEINYLGKEFFVLNPYFAKQYFPSSSVGQSAHFMILAEKGKNTYRIFILGGSAAMGDPDPSFSFSVMLHAMLKHSSWTTN